MTSAMLPEAVPERTRRAELAKAARREDILAAARRVFAEQGFRGTTIADIAEAAKIALGTIYLYFASKEDVFAALNQELSALIAAALTDAGGAQTLDDNVRTRIQNVFRVCGENRDLLTLVVLNTDRGSEVTQRLQQAEAARTAPMARGLERAMKAGLIRSADPAVMTKLINGLVSIAVYQAFVRSDGSDAETYCRMCSDMVTAYLRPA